MFDIWDSPLWNDLQDDAGNPFFKTATMSLGFSLCMYKVCAYVAASAVDDLWLVNPC